MKGLFFIIAGLFLIAMILAAGNNNLTATIIFFIASCASAVPVRYAEY